jgi:site-specific DNA-cytosine methylase
MEGETWRRSSVRWSNSGMAWDTGCSTLATSECRSADGECSSSESRLADVLEPSAPPRFYLSARAAAGILRRASKRGRMLPPELEMALTGLSTGHASYPTETAFALTHWGLTHDEPDRSVTSLATNGPSVRRLTPTECERLMGWPDGHTIVEGWQPRSTAAATKAASARNPESISSPIASGLGAGCRKAGTRRSPSEPEAA